MAQSSRVLNEIVQCAVCLGDLNNPYQLSCLHTYCYDCLTQLVNQQDVIQCPICREDTHKDSIKKDFKMHDIVNAYNAEKKVQRGDQFLQKLLVGKEKKYGCHLCENVNELAQSKCLECEQAMCRQCEKVHNSIKSCRNHTVLPSGNIVAALKEKIDSDRTQLQQQSNKKVGGLVAKLNKRSANLTAWKMESIDLLERTKQQHLLQIEEHYTKLKESINDLNSEAQKCLKQQDDAIKEYQEKVEVLDVTLISRVENGAVDQLLEIAEVGVGEVKSQVDELERNLEELNSDALSLPISIAYSRDLELHKTTHIVSSIGAFDSLIDNRVSKVRENKYKVTTSLKLDSLPQRLCVLNRNNICIGSDNTISVLNADCTFCEKLTISHLRDTRSLTQVHNGCLVAACDNGFGLHLLKADTEYLASIKLGSFCDVASWCFSVYALEYQQCRVVEFKEKRIHRWENVKEFKLNYSSRHSNSWDSISVNKDGIFVCALKTCSIYHYDHNGQLLQQFGEKGS